VARRFERPRASARLTATSVPIPLRPGQRQCCLFVSHVQFVTIYFMANVPETDPIAELLKRSKTIAVVGLSDNPVRPSHDVSAYMQAQGYRIIPVNPGITEALGEKAYSSLRDVPDRIDIVNIFRRSELVEEVVDEAIALKIPAIWMQEGVINDKAAAKARAAGAFVVMDRCILKDHQTRFR